MGAILGVTSLIQSALGIIATFKGNAEVAKVTGYVQDAVSVVSALTPLVTQFANGTEVTPEDVRVALAGKDDALKAFDDMIAQKEREAGGAT
jgi:hypothetical protein